MTDLNDQERLAQVEVRVEEQGGRLIEISQQVRDLDRKVDQRFGSLETRIDQRFTALDAKFEGRFQRFETRFDALGTKVEGKIDGLRTEMTRQFRWTIGIMLTLAGLLHFAR